MTGPYYPPHPELVAAATYEIDRRAKHYPKLVANCRLCPQVATLDFQAWHAIRDWLQTGQSPLLGMHGGVETGERARVIDWPLLEEAARKAVATVADLAAQAKPDKRAALEARGVTLTDIARRVAAQARLMGLLNAELRLRARAKAA